MVTDAKKLIQTIRDKLNRGDVALAMSDLRELTFAPLKVLDYQKINWLVDGHRHILLDYLGDKPLKLAILGGYTTQPIAVVLKTFLLSEGYLTDIYESEYNLYKMEVLNPESGLYAFKPDITLFATGSVNIEVFPEIGFSKDKVQAVINSLVQEYRDLWLTIKKRNNTLVIQHNFEPLEERTLGRVEDKYPWSHSRFIRSINERLWELDGEDAHILDVHGLVERIGVYNWYDPRWFYHSKHGFNPNLTFEYGRLFCGLFRALMGKAKKCLVTDLDNTLWGGIIGDDGVHGVHLGNISPQGEAYRAFCDYLKELKNRGIILAVNSKNDFTLVKEVFTKHPEMPLSLDDFAAFYCNWESKSSNLREIAKKLNISTDALVFIDDNPVECAEAREMVPEVTVVEMGGDPAYFIRKLDQLHLFDQLDITSEDLIRAESYITQCKIDRVRQSTVNIEEFFINLDMVGRVSPAVLDDVPRIEQMFKKISQFNLTSRRHDRASILQFIQDRDKFCLSCWLKDKFVNYGLVSVVVGYINNNGLFIDNWIMSCRVFSRTFEEFIFNQISSFAIQRQCSIIEGEFIPTDKNSYVRNLFSKLGFTTCEDNEIGRRWTYRLSDNSEIKCFVRNESYDGMGV